VTSLRSRRYTIYISRGPFLILRHTRIIIMGDLRSPPENLFTSSRAGDPLYCSRNRTCTSLPSVLPSLSWTAGGTWNPNTYRPPLPCIPTSAFPTPPRPSPPLPVPTPRIPLFVPTPYIPPPIPTRAIPGPCKPGPAFEPPVPAWKSESPESLAGMPLQPNGSSSPLRTPYAPPARRRCL
jgi:hypothetical protein